MLAVVSDHFVGRRREVAALRGWLDAAVRGAGCLVLVATLPWQSVVAGVAVFAVGIGYRLVRLRQG